jgi:M6 family metalloprotease-like protein
LVVPVEFSDVKHTRTVSSIYGDYLGPYPSVASYYEQGSYGQLKVSGTVTDWLGLAGTMVQYGSDAAGGGVDTGTTGGGGSLPASANLVSAAESALAASNSTINPSDYDYFVVLHAGAGQESNTTHTDLIWSVAYQSGLRAAVQCGCRYSVDAADVVPEFEERGAVPMGVYAHELGHLFGLPDLYKAQTQMMGPWELMDGGVWNGHPYGSSPAELSAWSRLKVGWLQPSEIRYFNSTSSGFALLNPLETPSGGYAAAEVQASSTLYYMIEVRQPIEFDKGLPDFGVVTYSVSTAEAGSDSLHKVQTLESAFHTGYLFQSSAGEPVDFKIFAGFANGSYLVGFGQSGFIKTATLTIKVLPPTPNTTLLVNGQAYMADSNGTVTVLDYSGNPTGFNVTTPQTTSIGPGMRSRFASWSTGSTSETLTLPGNNATISASYKIQYTVNVISLYGNSTGTGWYDDGTNATLSTTSPVNATQPDTRHTFARWTGDYNETSNPITVQVLRPLNLTATWKTQYHVTVDTADHAFSTGSGWYDTGATANFTVTPPPPDNGTWYIFKGWTGNYTGTSMSGFVNVTAPARVKVAWTTLEWTIFRFVDADNNSVTPPRITNAQLVASNGTTVPVNMTSTAQWLVNGTYSVTIVQSFGVNVAGNNQTFATSPNGAPTIHLALFDLTFSAHDLIATSPVAGVNVTIALPDGTPETAISGTDGRLVFTQLPAFEYPYRVTGGWVLQASGTAKVTQSQTTVQVPLLVLPTLLGLAAAITVIGLVAFMFMSRRRRGRGRKRAKRSRKKKKRSKKNSALVKKLLSGELKVGPGGELVAAEKS